MTTKVSHQARLEFAGNPGGGGISADMTTVRACKDISDEVH